MTIKQTYSYRHAEAILAMSYAAEQAEIVTALTAAPWSLRAAPVTVRRGKPVYFDIDQSATNKAIEAEFVRIGGWSVRPRIVSAAAKSQLAADFRKSKVQIEVQFGNMARWYTDVFKFLLSYSADDIEVGVLAVPMQATASRIDENVAYFERVVRELPHAKMGITLPIWVIGLS